MKHLVLRCWWLVLVGVSACFSPQFDDGQIKCGPNNECPPGLSCSGGVCRAGNGPKDAADTMGPPAPMLMSVTPTSPANNNNPVVIGTAEAGSTITIFTDGSCTTEAATGMAAELASPGITVPVTDNTTNAFTAKATDTAGNASACSTAISYVEDSAAPSTPSITSSVPPSPSRSIVPSIRGTAEAGTVITLYGNDTCSGAMIGTGTTPVSGDFAITATVPAAQVTKVTGIARDAAGNASPCSSFLIYEQDASAVGTPSLAQATTPASPSNSSTTPMISGTAEAGITVRLYTDSSCGGTVVAMGTADTNGAFSIGVTVGANSTTTFYAQAFDGTVNQSSPCSQSSVTYVHDTVAPPVPMITGSTPTPPSNMTMPTINGTAEPGATVELYTTSNCVAPPDFMGVANAGGMYSIPISATSSITQVYAMARDAAGNTSNCTAASFTYTLDSVAPGAPTMLVTVPASPSTTNNTPLVTGNAEAGSTVRIFRTADCTGAEAGQGIASTPLGSFGIGVTLASNSSTPLTANATDVAGNTSVCSSMLTYLHDSLAPAPPTIMASTPASPSGTNNPSISGLSEGGASVRLYTDSSCATPIGSAATANAAGAFSIAITVTDNTSTALYAKATDTAGNVSTCSPSAFTYNEDSAAPAAPVLNSIPPSSTSTMPTLTGSAEAGTTVAVFASSSCGGTMVATGPATGGTFSIGVTVTANASTPFSARVTDAAGNISPCSSAITYIHDNMTPSAPSGLATTPTSPAGSNNPSVTGTAEANSTVRLFTNPTCSTAVAGTATATGGGTFSVSLTVASGSTTTFYATTTDAAGNSSSCSTSFVTYSQDSAAPPAPASLASNPTSPSPTMTPAVTGSTEANAVVKLYTNSTCTSAVAFMGTANGSGAFSIPTSVTANATTTFWATATDSAGNASPCSSANLVYVHDAIVPGTPAITAASPSSPANNNSPSISGTAETGTTVKLFTTANCTTGQLASGTASAGAFAISISVADNSMTNIYASATDAAGNVSGCSTVLTYTEDSAVPGTPSGLSTNPVSPVHDTSPSVTGSAETGATIRIYTSASCAGAVAGSATAVGGMFSVPVSVSANSTTTFYARATDAAGNQSGCSSSVTYIEDSDPPSVPTITGTTPASPANNNSPTVTGTADTGSIVRIYSNAACTTQVGSGTASAGAFSFVVSTALPGDTTTTLYARATDPAGNASACTTNAFTYVEDSTAPNAPANLTTTPPSPANANFPSINGTAEVGALVRAYTNNMCTGTPAGSATAGAGGAFSIGVNVADNSTTTFYVTARDAALNTSACMGASISYTENSNAVEPPTLLSTTPASPSRTSTTPTLNGSSGAGFTIRVYTNPTCTTQIAMATADAAGNFSIPVTATANATTTFYATATEVNTSACSLGLAYVHDSNAPSPPNGLFVTPASPANNNNPTIGGDAEAGATITLYTNSNCSSAPVGSGTSTGVFSIAATAVANNSTTTYYATAMDPAGNLSACSSGVTYVEDSAAPALPTVTSTTPSSPSTSNTTPSVNGGAETGSTVRLYTTADCSGTVAGQGTAGTGNAYSIPVTVAANSTTTFRVTATDAAGNASACSTTSVTYTHDNQAPSVPSGLTVTPAGPANNNSPAVGGSADTGSTVRIYTNAMCTGTAAGTGTASAGTFSITVSVGNDTTTTFFATASDGAGNTSACSALPGVTYIEDSLAPATPQITNSNPSSPSKTSTTPTINGTADTGSTVSLYTTSNCTGTVVASATAGAPGGFAIPVTVTANTSTTFYAKATDAANNGSGCSPAFTYTHDNLTPGTPTISGTNPASPANNNNPAVNGTSEANATITLYTAAACTTAAASGTANASGNFSVTLPVADNTTTQIYARATDAAGNASGCTTAAVTYQEDSSAPGIPTLSTITANPANNNSPVITGSTNEAGVTIKLYSNSTCTSTVLGTGTSTAGPPVGAFSVTASVGNDTTTTFYANATDAAGNISGCSTVSLTYIEDSTAPSVPTSMGTSPPSPSNSNNVSVTGTTSAGVTVRVFKTNNCTGTFTSGTSNAAGGFSIAQTVTTDTTTVFSALAVDSANNASACSQPIQYIEDSTANPPVLASTDPVSPSSTETALTILGTGEAKTTIRIFTNSTCSGAGFVTAGDIEGDGTFRISVTVGENTSTTFWGYIEDQAGNTSACSNTSVTYVHDSKPPSIPSMLTATATATDKILVSWASSMDNFTPASSMRYDLCWRDRPVGACTGTATTGAGATQFTISNLATSARYWIEVRAVDGAGNASAYTNTVTDKTWGPGASAQVSSGENYTCVRQSDGTVWCWGANAQGQLGDGSTTDRYVPVKVVGLEDVISVSASAADGTGTHTCAAKSNGSVFCWGDNQAGQLGNGTLNDSSTPVQVNGIGNAIAVSTGAFHSCALLSGGQIKCWGAGSSGRLGNGGMADSSVPVLVMGISTAIAVDLGAHHSCALLGDGTVRCWGAGGLGRLGNGMTTDQTTPVVVGLTGTDRAKSLDAGSYHNCVVVDSGQARCWGYNSNGQVGDNTINNALTPVPVKFGANNLLGVVSISAGGGPLGYSTCVTRVDGETRCFGSNTYGQLGDGTTNGQTGANTVVSGSTAAFVQTSVGDGHACALLANGRIQCWGYGANGRLGDGGNSNRTTPFGVLNLNGPESGVAVASGQGLHHACAKLSNGRIHCWGYNYYGQLGDGLLVTRPYPLDYVLDAGDAMITNAVTVATGQLHSCAIRADGSIWCWGYNGDGQLGDNTVTNRDTAVQVAGLSAAIQVTAGFSHTCALGANGQVFCWGRNSSGQLGNGTTNGSNVPVVVSGISNAKRIAAQGQSTCAILGDGSVRCWGYNSFGATGDGTTVTPRLTPVVTSGVNNAAAIGASGYGACVRLAGGGIQCWGYGTYGQMGNGSNGQNNPTPVTVTGTGNYVDITGGGYHYCATRTDGAPQCWGYNGRGQIGNNSLVDRNVPTTCTALGTISDMGGGDQSSCGLHSDGTLECWGWGYLGVAGDGDETDHNVVVARTVLYFP